MQEKALLLRADYPSSDDHRAERLLEFFGVRCQKRRTIEFGLQENECVERYRLVCSAQAFARVVRDLQNVSRNSNSIARQIHSVFLYSNGDPVALANAVSQLSGATISIHRETGGDIQWRIADDPDGMCRTMRDLCIRPAATARSFDFFHTDGSASSPLIAAGNKVAFLKLTSNGVPVFISSERLIDIDAELISQNFDVREHFLSAVPLVLYIKWAFAETCWNSPEANACLVIDDPVLKTTHGFVDFRELLSLMKRHNFSTNIAFIPWNWRRSAAKVVQLFRENPERYSLSVHGCDHTRAEFGSSSKQRLYWKAQQALERMNCHESITGIRHDPVMVFPQGIFSEAAMSVLKHTDLIAAVNNDVICAGPRPCAITIADVWDIAVMRYSNFPIFTRRYPWEGIENFAFDTLLGKPTIAVIHHDYCSDHCVRLVNFIERLNARQGAPTWRNLGDVVRRSCRQREVSPGAVEVEMYATELRIENRSHEPKHFLIRRRECEPSAIDKISTGAQEIAWRAVDGRIDFEIELHPGENQVIKIKFHNLAGEGHNGDNLPYSLKTMLRRYLCEVRDNYIVPLRCRFAGSR